MVTVPQYAGTVPAVGDGSKLGLGKVNGCKGNEEGENDDELRRAGRTLRRWKDELSQMLPGIDYRSARGYSMRDGALWMAVLHAAIRGESGHLKLARKSTDL